MKTCNSCKTDNDNAEKLATITMTQGAYDMNEDRHERREKRLIWIIIALIALNVAMFIGFLIYESQFTTVEGAFELEQHTDNGNNNYIGNDGDIYNGYTNHSETLEISH